MCAAPTGNQFWKLRSKHGRDLIFSSPTVLWEACVEYFEATDARKWIRKDWVGKDAKEVEREIDTPYTLTGLFVFLDITKPTWQEYRNREDFSYVITRVEQIMFTQKFEGAAVGAFNASIIARDLGLKDASEVNITADRKAVADLFPEELEGDGQDHKPQP
jgi:hypothetical protein